MARKWIRNVAEWLDGNEARAVRRIERKFEAFRLSPNARNVRNVPDGLMALASLYGARFLRSFENVSANTDFASWSLSAYEIAISLHTSLCSRESSVRTERSFFWHEMIGEAAHMACISEAHYGIGLEILERFFNSQDKADREVIPTKQFELFVLSMLRGVRHPLLTGAYERLFLVTWLPDLDAIQAIAARRLERVNNPKEIQLLPFGYAITEILLINRLRLARNLEPWHLNSELANLTELLSHTTSVLPLELEDVYPKLRAFM